MRLKDLKDLNQSIARDIEIKWCRLEDLRSIDFGLRVQLAYQEYLQRKPKEKAIEKHVQEIYFPSGS